MTYFSQKHRENTKNHQVSGSEKPLQKDMEKPTEKSEGSKERPDCANEEKTDQVVKNDHDVLKQLILDLDLKKPSQLLDRSGKHKLTLIYAAKTRSLQQLQHLFPVPLCNHKGFNSALLSGNWKTLKSIVVNKNKELKHRFMDEIFAQNLVNLIMCQNCGADVLSLVLKQVKIREVTEDYDHQGIISVKEFINERDSRGMTHLIKAVLTRNVNCLKKLLELGADKNLTDSKVLDDYDDDDESDPWRHYDVDSSIASSQDDGNVLYGILHDFYRDPNVVPFFDPKLLNQFNDCNELDENEMARFKVFDGTSLSRRIIKPKDDYFDARKDMLFGERKTPLMYAVCIGDPEIVRILFDFDREKSVNISAIDTKGKSALDYAALMGDLESLRIILKPKPNTDDGRTSSRKTSKSNSKCKNSKNHVQFQQSDKDKGNSHCLVNTQKHRNHTIPEKTFATALIYAVLGGNIECVKLLLSYCTVDSLNNVTKKGKTALMLACQKGWTECAALLLKNSAVTDSINKRSMGVTPLMLACLEGHVDCMKALLTAGALVDAKDNYGYSALMYCVMKDRVHCAEKLINYEADLEQRNNKTQTPLLFALEAGKGSCIKLLVLSGAKIDARDRARMDALSYAACFGDCSSVELLLKELVAKDKIVNKDLSEGLQLQSVSDTAVAFTDRNGNPSASESCCVDEDGEKDIKDQANMNNNNNCVGLGDACDVLASTAPKCKSKPLSSLLTESTTCDFRITLDGLPKELVYHGDPNEDVSLTGGVSEKNVCWFAERALPFAGESGSVDCIKLLLPHCTTYNKGDELTRTALMNAVCKGHLECAKVLLQHGADVDFVFDKNGFGCSAIVCAVLFTLSSNTTEMIKLLLENGADPDRGTDNQLRCPLGIATKHGDTLSVDMLVKYKANVNLIRNGISPLAYAVGQENRVYCRDILVEAGAKMNISELYELYFDVDVVNHIFHDAVEWQYLMEKGVLTTEKRTKSALLEADGNLLYRGGNGSRIKTSRKARVIKFLMEQNAFDFGWWWSNQNAWIILLLAVQTKTAPCQFRCSGLGPTSEITSPLLYALRRSDHMLVRFLLRNLYFTWDDYVNITNNKLLGNLKQDLLLQQPVNNYNDSGENDDDQGSRDSSFDYFGDFDEKSPVSMLCSNRPWPLELLCLVRVSTALFDNQRNSETFVHRDKQVASLPIPDKFKTILRFEGNNSRLCMSQWYAIGDSDWKISTSKLLNNEVDHIRSNDKKEEEDEEEKNRPGFDSFMCLSKPLYPFEDDLIPCHHKNKNCFGFGLTLAVDPKSDESSSDSSGWEDEYENYDDDDDGDYSFNDYDDDVSYGEEHYWGFGSDDDDRYMHGYGAYNEEDFAGDYEDYMNGDGPPACITQ